MYLNQIIQFHAVAACGVTAAPEHKVIESLSKGLGISYQDAARRLDMAVMLGDARRVQCVCNSER